MKQHVNIEGNWHEVEDGKATWLEPSLLPSSECNGNACGDVSIDYLGVGRGFRFTNNGNRRLRIRIRFTFGFQCMDWSNIDLNPRQSEEVLNGGYCHPMEANYI